MFRKNRTITALLATAAVTALLAPAAQGQDLRSPDTKDVAAPTQSQDLRSPDASVPVPQSSTRTDLRSPDTRDSGGPQPSSPAVGSSQPEGGLQWDDPAVVGIGVGLLAIAGLAALVAVSRHRRTVTTG